MKLSELLKMIDGNWHGEFVRFVQEGEASDDFLAYLDANRDCQKAVDMAFEAQARGLEDLGQALCAHVPVEEDGEPDVQKAVHSMSMLKPSQRDAVMKQLGHMNQRLTEPREH